MQLGDQKPVWITLDEIWEPKNIALYLPAWRDYCEKKRLPPDWGGAIDSSLVATKMEVDKEIKEDDFLNLEDIDDATTHNIEPILNGITEDTGKEKESEEQGVCFGHVLDDKGRVHMKLRWTDTGDESYGEVRKIMKSEWERRHLGKTWFEYCDTNFLVDDLFRMEGMSKVLRINGHEWGDDGRPVAEILWKHGDASKVLVKNAMEKNDDNGFKAAWTSYCDGIEGADEGLYKGNMRKDRIVEKGKKKRKRGS